MRSVRMTEYGRQIEAPSRCDMVLQRKLNDMVVFSYVE